MLALTEYSGSIDGTPDSYILEGIVPFLTNDNDRSSARPEDAEDLANCLPVVRDVLQYVTAETGTSAS